MEIVVQGKATEYFTPDEIELNLNFYTKGLTYNDVLLKGVNDVQTFVNEILLMNGFDIHDMKTSSFVIRKEQKYDEVTRSYIFDGFSFNQSANLKFDYDKEKLMKIMEELSTLQNAPSCQINFGVKDIDECKRKILSKAYEDAKMQAEAIALAANKNLKQCMKVDFKPFGSDYISQTSLESNMMYEAAKNSGVSENLYNTFTPEDIEVSETLYCLWISE